MSEATRDRPRTARGRLALLAPGAIVALALAGCMPTADSTSTPEPIEPRNLTLQLGSLLPQTGSFAMFGPATLAAVDLAVQDVNDADAGIELVHEARDAGDGTSDVGLASTDELLDLGSTVIIGPVSDGVSKKVIGTITGAGVLQISPGNSAPDFTRFADDDLYWRTAPSCALEGTAMGQQIFDDGAKTLGVLAQADFCAPVLQQALVAQFERAGGEVVAEQTFESTLGSLTEQNAAIVDADPDAVVMITQNQAKLSVPDLLAAGYQGPDLYFVGLALGDHSSDLGGSIVGSHASLPGLDIAELEDFTDRLLELNPGITDFSFAAETYDAVVLAALGALAANDTRGVAIAGQLRAISGGSGQGELATDFASAADLVLAGKPVDYDGRSGSITFDERGDPLGASIGIYEYQDDNTWTRQPS
jgi:branched-chain amino acid transport system substrate-binding protein